MERIYGMSRFEVCTEGMTGDDDGEAWSDEKAGTK